MKGSLKIWMVILGMVVLGTGITHMTNSYVSHQIEKMAATAEEGNAAERMLSPEAVPEVAEEALPEGQAVLTQKQADAAVDGDLSEPLAIAEEGEEDEIAEEEADAAEPAPAEAKIPGGKEISEEDEALKEDKAGQSQAGSKGTGQRKAGQEDTAPEEAMLESGQEPSGQGNTGQVKAERPGGAPGAVAAAEDTDGGAALAAGEVPREGASQGTVWSDSESGAVLKAGGTGSAAGGAGGKMAGSTTGGKMAAQESADAPANLQEALREYQERFPQIDQQIEQMRTSETENNVYSVKTTAQTEMRIWERELDGLYRLLCDSLDEAACQALEKEQQEWMQFRDERAEEAAKRNSGGSLESVEYLASIAASDRERAYALLTKYQE